MEGSVSGSVQIITDPDPEGSRLTNPTDPDPKTMIFPVTNAEVDEAFRMKKRSLHHLTQLLNLLLAATNIAVRHVRLLLDLFPR
jgi:hypothetical protein